jgi:hypothetical protein
MRLSIGPLDVCLAGCMSKSAFAYNISPIKSYRRLHDMKSHELVATWGKRSMLVNCMATETWTLSS